MESLSAPLVAGSVVRPPAVALRLATDRRLARLAAAGVDGAMAAIFERHHQALHRYCQAIVGNSHDAGDALQNTMVKVLRALPGEARQIALRPWLYRIAYNESISLLRTRRTDGDLDAAADLSDPKASGVAESRERLRSLTADLSELTDRQRGALLMRELGGLDFGEVALALDTTPAAAKQSVYEARCALQAMEEGRAMDCDVVRRALSDGDRRTLHGIRISGHLRDCAGCREFASAIRARPAHLTAMIPPLPIGVAAAMLHGIAGGAGTHAGGVAVGLAGGATSATGLSLAAKVATVVAVSATLAGGAVYVAPHLHEVRPGHATKRGATAASTPITAPSRGGVAPVAERARSAGGIIRSTAGARATTTAAARGGTLAGASSGLLTTPAGGLAVSTAGSSGGGAAAPGSGSAGQSNGKPGIGGKPTGSSGANAGKGTAGPGGTSRAAARGRAGGAPRVSNPASTTTDAGRSAGKSVGNPRTPGKPARTPGSTASAGSGAARTPAADSPAGAAGGSQTTPDPSTSQSAGPPASVSPGSGATAHRGGPSPG